MLSYRFRSRIQSLELSNSFVRIRFIGDDQAHPMLITLIGDGDGGGGRDGEVVVADRPWVGRLHRGMEHIEQPVAWAGQGERGEEVVAHCRDW